MELPNLRSHLEPVAAERVKGLNLNTSTATVSISNKAPPSVMISILRPLIRIVVFLSRFDKRSGLVGHLITDHLIAH